MLKPHYKAYSVSSDDVSVCTRYGVRRKVTCRLYWIKKKIKDEVFDLICVISGLDLLFLEYPWNQTRYSSN